MRPVVRDCVWGVAARGLPPAGPWIAVLTLAGACLGYPLLLWLDPLALLAGAFTPWQRMAQPAAWLAAFGLPAVLLVCLVWPGGWCAALCPLGALQDLLWHGGRAARKAATRRAAARRAATRQRLLPSPLAGEGLGVRGPRGQAAKLGRRSILAAVAGGAWAAALRPWRAASAASASLRPPGAVAEARFGGVCIRCGNCVRACPTRIIQPDLGRQGLAGLLAPVVQFDDDYCHEDCTRCMDVCPSGALQPLSPSGKIAAPLGLPQVVSRACLLSDDRECGLCHDHCPLAAVSLAFSPADYTVIPRVDPAKCSGCGACEVVCPTTPKAIVVQPRRESEQGRAAAMLDAQLRREENRQTRGQRPLEQ